MYTIFLINKCSLTCQFHSSLGKREHPLSLFPSYVISLALHCFSIDFRTTFTFPLFMLNTKVLFMSDLLYITSSSKMNTTHIPIPTDCFVTRCVKTNRKKRTFVSACPSSCHWLRQFVVVSKIMEFVGAILNKRC